MYSHSYHNNSFTWQGCNLVKVLPMPSTVVTANPSSEHIGKRQAFADICLLEENIIQLWHIVCSMYVADLILLVCGLYCDNITVHAPQPPSPHPNLVPVKCTKRRNQITISLYLYSNWKWVW